MDLSHLNAAQRTAVTTTEGPLLVLAGAGSGKTRVITHRVAKLIDMGVAPDSIVALTFTNKAAGEMRERLQQMVGAAVASELCLSTFHSLGVRMLREDHRAFGVPKRFSILDQGDVYGIVRGLLRELGFHGREGDRRFDLGGIVQRISLWKNEFLDDAGARLKAKYGTEYDEIAADLYPHYRERLEQLGGVDFDDLVCRVAATLHQNDKLRARWQRKFTYVMVDEYQDTNHAQFEMLRGLVGERENLCVVGDDDQAIYGWRGAKVANILGFDRVYPKTKVVKLETNYRSNKGILSAANSVIKHNSERHPKKLKVSRRGSQPVASVTCRDGDHEAQWVGDQVRKAILEDGIRADEIAVLYRSARQARPIEERLQEHGIPYRVVGGQSFYDKKDVKDVLAYLKLLVAPFDDLALRRALDVPPRGIGAKTVQRLQGWADNKNKRLLDAVHHADEIEGIGPRPLRSLKHFSSIVRTASNDAKANKSVAAPLRAMIDAVALRENVRKDTGNDAATLQRWNGVEWLFGSVERFEASARAKGRGQWLEYLSTLTLDSRETEEGEEQTTGQVTLATLHSAKGLEWSRVFMVGCEEGTIPHKRVAVPKASDAIDGDIEEERRLFYVGVTRARDQLYLTRAGMRLDRGRELAVQPSRFLQELPKGEIRDYDVASEEQLSGDQMDQMADAFLAKFVTEEPPGG
jgi:DNA helicase-2/ATP-dependent DNA helicase PcrA